MKRKSIYLLGLLTMACAQQSCVDKSYDLDNIDMTLGNNIDITLPTSSTADIQLRSFMDLEDDGVVQFIGEDSVFAVIQDGEADIKDISIDPITFNPDLTDIETIVSLSELEESSQFASRRRVKIQVPVAGSIVDVTIPNDIEYHYPIQPGTAKYSIDANDPNAQSTISEDIISIDKVIFEDNTTLAMTIRLGNSPELEWLPKFTIQDLTLKCPEDMMITHCFFMENEVGLSGDGLYHLTDKSGTKISFNDEERDGIQLKLKVKGVKIGQDGDLSFDPSTHEVRIAGSFELGGTFRISTSDIDENRLNAYLQTLGNSDKLAQVVATQSILPLLPGQLAFTGQANFGDGIMVKEFYGKLQHAVGEIAPIELNDLPDFLNDDDVVLDLDNPIILLEACQGLPIQANTAITLTATDEGRETHISIPAFNISGNNDTVRFYIADKELTGDDRNILPKAYRNAAYLPHEGNIAELIKDLPEEIYVKVDDITLDASQTPVDLTKDYKIYVGYKVYAPLTLGQEFQMVYRGTDTGWSKDLEDLEDVNVGEITLTAQVESNLPAAVKLNLTPIDAAENTIPQLNVNSIEVAPQTVSDITFTLKANSGYTLNDIITGRNGVNQLDGVKYEARIDEAKAGAALTKNASIKLKNIKVRIRGGVSYDAN